MKKEEKKQEEITQESEQTQTQTPAIETLQISLQEKEALIQKQSQVLNHPQIQEALVLLSEGKTLNLSPESTPEAKEQTMKDLLGHKADPKSVDLNGLSNVELVDVISEVVESFVSGQRDSAGKEIDTRMAEISAKLDKSQEMVLSLVASQQVKDASTKYTDFDEFRTAMQEIVQKNPTLSIDEAYKLARYDKLDKGLPPAQTESEKPESSGVFPQWPVKIRDTAGEITESTGPSTTALRRGGSRSFRKMVEEAAERQIKQ